VDLWREHGVFDLVGIGSGICMAAWGDVGRAYVEFGKIPTCCFLRGLRCSYCIMFARCNSSVNISDSMKGWGTGSLKCKYSKHYCSPG